MYPELRVEDTPIPGLQTFPASEYVLFQKDDVEVMCNFLDDSTAAGGDREIEYKLQSLIKILGLGDEAMRKVTGMRMRKAMECNARKEMNIKQGNKIVKKSKRKGKGKMKGETKDTELTNPLLSDSVDGTYTFHLRLLTPDPRSEHRR
jgi:hypothetical protein